MFTSKDKNLKTKIITENSTPTVNNLKNDDKVADFHTYFDAYVRTQEERNETQQQTIISISSIFNDLKN